jgi:DNA-binding ferritin-like protein
MRTTNPDVPKSLTDLVAVFRAAYQVHRDSHWRVGGNGFYGNHLLLERLYTETANNADKLAERVVGLYGESWLEGNTQANRIAHFVKQSTRTQPLMASWAVSMELHDKIAETYADLKKQDKLSLGTDDLLMSLQSSVEQHLYLLQQTGLDRDQAKQGTKKFKQLKARLLR